MKLHNLKIQGFKRHKEINISFLNASFLIGENNTGKSTILKAVELLLNDTMKIPDSNFFKCNNDNTNTCDDIVLTGEFRGLPSHAETWRGFKGRVFRSTELDDNGKEIVINSIFYRKTFKVGKNRIIEMKSRKKNLKTNLQGLSSIDDFIDLEFNKDWLRSTDFESFDTSKKMGKVNLKEFIDLFENQFEFYDYLDDEIWDENPGGIAGNVLSKLPKVLYIPAHDGADDISENKGAFQSILTELFTEVRDSSENYIKAQESLNKLADELNPESFQTEFGLMMKELNGTLSGVFSGIGLNAKATLSDANTAIKPTFEVSMTSNITTSVDMQGTGVIRSTVFALLRYKALRDINRKQIERRSLIICFEEPEIYLHPNAANQMRDTIYELASTTNNQIICSTHSPYMINLGKRTDQVLNYLHIKQENIELSEGEKIKCDIVYNKPFNIEEAFKKLENDDKDYVKFLLKMDDELAKIFFAKNILIVEGDTEDIVLRETISIMPEEMKKNVLSNWQIIKARGKPVIISLIKYLKIMGIVPYVMHDLDTLPGATKYNPHIKEALGNDNKLFPISNCIEDVLGYEIKGSDKPYKAYKFIQENWNNSYTKITPEWKEIIEKIFSNY